MKFKDYSADSPNGSGSRSPHRAAKKPVSKASQTMSKVISQVAHDADTLLTLDELYTALSSLVMLAQPDADYNGIADANKLNQIIDEAVHQLPVQYQAVGQAEVKTVKTLLSKHAYREANLLVMKWAKVIGEHIENLREAPQDVQTVLGHKAQHK